MGYEFSYDARNRCARRTRWTRIGQGQWQATKTNLYYDGWNLVEEQTAKDELIARYVHGAQIDEMVKRSTNDADFYYHQDALGSTVALTDSDGRVVERYSYDVYGAPTFMDSDGNVVSTSLSGNRFLFTGREYLGEIGLYDYRNRFYSPDFGRFLQTDPLGFDAGDVNLYRYVKNDVLNHRDPFGLVDDDPLGLGPPPAPNPTRIQSWRTAEPRTAGEWRWKRVSRLSLLYKE